MVLEESYSLLRPEGIGSKVEPRGEGAALRGAVTLARGAPSSVGPPITKPYRKPAGTGVQVMLPTLVSLQDTGQKGDWGQVKTPRPRVLPLCVSSNNSGTRYPKRPGVGQGKIDTREQQNGSHNPITGSFFSASGPCTPQPTGPRSWAPRPGPGTLCKVQQLRDETPKITFHGLIETRVLA